MGARNKMYFNSPSWLFSLVRGEHRIILSSRLCGQWAFREFGVRRLCTFWGGNEEDFYQTDTVPPSGRRWRERRRTASVSCWSRNKSRHTEAFVTEVARTVAVKYYTWFYQEKSHEGIKIHQRLVKEDFFIIGFIWPLFHWEVTLRLKSFFFFLLQVRLSQDTVRKAASWQQQQVKVQ